MDKGVSDPLLYPEKTALKGQVPLITTGLRCEAERSPSHSSFCVGGSVYIQFFYLAVSWRNHAFTKTSSKILIHQRNSNAVQKETRASESFQKCLCYPHNLHHTKTSSSPSWHSTLSATLTQSNTVAQHRSNFPIRSVAVLSRTHSIS